MANDGSIRIKDNSDKFIKAMHEQVALGLEAIGIDAQNYATRDCP